MNRHKKSPTSAKASGAVTHSLMGGSQITRCDGILLFALQAPFTAAIVAAFVLSGPWLILLREPSFGRFVHESV